MDDRLNIAESGNLYIFSMLAMTALQFFAMFALIGINSEFGGIETSSWINYALNQMAVIATTIIYIKSRKKDPVKVLKMNKVPGVKVWILLPFIWIFTIIAFFPLTQMFNDLLYLIGYRGGVAVPFEGGAGVYILSLFIIAIIPAIGEELLVRGGILSGLFQKNSLFAVFISALLFSMMHQNPLQTVYQFFFGVVLAFVVIFTRSVWAAVFTHLLNNAFTLTVSFFAKDMVWFDFGVYNYIIYVACFLVGFVILVFLLTVLRKLTSDGNLKEKNIFKLYGKALRGIFTKKGWREFSETLSICERCETYVSNRQYMINIYFAIGFAVLWWVVALIKGFI